GRGVLACESVTQGNAPGWITRRFFQQATEEVRVTEVDLEALEPERAQPLDRHRDDLDLGFGLLEPDQLDAGLIELAIVGHLRLVVPEHVGDVREAHGLGLLAEPRGHDARDLRRDVRAQRQHTTRLAIDELEHALLHADVGAHRQDVGKLERRGHDLAITPAREDVEQAALDVPLAGGLVGQVDARPLRQLRVNGLHELVSDRASRCASVFIRCTVTQSPTYSSSVIPAGDASTDHSRPGPSPSAARTIRRTTTACVTAMAVSPGWAATSRSTVMRTRVATAPSGSPPAGVTRWGVSRQASASRGNCRESSSRPSPSHAPNAISRRSGSTRGSRRCGLADGSAQIRARPRRVVEMAADAAP